jgi:hypothetical protein
MSVEVIYDETMPTHTLLVTASGDDVRVTCHPDIEPQAAAALRHDVAVAALGADRDVSIDEAGGIWLGGDED